MIPSYRQQAVQQLLIGEGDITSEGARRPKKTKQRTYFVVLLYMIYPHEVKCMRCCFGVVILGTKRTAEGAPPPALPATQIICCRDVRVCTLLTRTSYIGRTWVQGCSYSQARGREGGRERETWR